MIRNFLQQDKTEIMEMVSEFYNGPGVIHKIPVKNFEKAFDDMVNITPYLRGLSIICQNQIAGYVQLSFSYSTEAGGRVVWIEELYIKPEFRSHGLGKEAINYIKAEYRGKAARLRLEVAPENPRAAKLYAALGFKPLCYNQLINEDF